MAVIENNYFMLLFDYYWALLQTILPAVDKLQNCMVCIAKELSVLSDSQIK